MAHSICLAAKKGELEEVKHMLAGGWDKDAVVPQESNLQPATANKPIAVRSRS